LAVDPLLAVSDLSVSYGRLQVLRNVAFEIAAGETLAVLGPNGAGKTSLLRGISGIMVRRRGSIRFGDREIGRSDPHEIVALGIAHVPEGRHLFSPLSVRDNLEMGALTVRRRGLHSEAVEARRFVYEMFPRLTERLDQVAATLSGGEQQMLAIGRALMSQPKLLLLDEPSVGLAPRILEDVMAALRKLREIGLTILIAEQNVSLALELANRAVVLRSGQIAMTGSADALRQGSELRRIYLGDKQDKPVPMEKL
jgi:branched-chain amino acid transport system ATP-binding protein